MGLQIQQKLSLPGTVLASPLFENAIDAFRRADSQVGQLDQMTLQNAALVEEAAAAASRLEQQARTLQTSVSTFKLR